MAGCSNRSVPSRVPLLEAQLTSRGFGERYVEREDQPPGAIMPGEHVDERAAILDDLAIEADPGELDTLDDAGVAGEVSAQLIAGDVEDLARRAREAVQQGRAAGIGLARDAKDDLGCDQLLELCAIATRQGGEQRALGLDENQPG